MGVWHAMGFGWLLPILFIAVFIYLFSSKREERSPRGKSAEELLKERFAKGEIDEKTFKHHIELLQGGPHET